MNEEITKFGLPRDYVSCPGCGRLYGHHKTKVHVETEECSSCMPGHDKGEYLSAIDFIEHLNKVGRL